MDKEVPVLIHPNKKRRTVYVTVAVSIGLLPLALTPFLLQRHHAEQAARANRQRHQENRRIVVSAAERLDLPAELLLAVAQVESGFDEKAISERGAIGLMQLMPVTARETAACIGLTDWTIENPADNALIGAAYLTAMLHRYRNDLHLALAAYHAGPANVDKWSQAAADLPGPETIELFAFKGTKKYVADIVGRIDAQRRIKTTYAEECLSH
jgi:soluble lytic murein transglycosylase-like protein